jgi:Amt family ammonium transporter
MNAAQPLDLLWVLLCSALVFSMQAGFLCLESGLTRSKNSINVAVKNVADFAAATAVFWMFGFGLMFGDSVAGWFGGSHFGLRDQLSLQAPLMTFLLFQMMFCATSATIVSGAVAERMRFSTYLAVTVGVAALVYPVFGHWAWGGGLQGEPAGWLARMGFVDFAGSTVVHSVGGWVSLVAVITIGARTGRFVRGEAPRPLPAGNLPLAMLGVLILFFGWFGFNGGSTLALNEQVPGIIVNTVIAGSAGIVGGIAIGIWRRGYCEIGYLINGAIAGLVAITATCHVVTPLQSWLIGLVAAALMVLATEALLRLQIDDAVGAIPAHLVPGIWGTLSVGLFGDLERIANGNTRWEQLGVQLLGVVVCFAWSCGTAWLLLRMVRVMGPLRVLPQDEHIGLNVSEHGTRTDLIELVDAMEEHRRSGDLRQRVPVEPFTEVGQVASAYNQVLNALEVANDQTRAIVRDMNDGIVTFTREGILTSLNPGAEKLLQLRAEAVVGHPFQALLRHAGYSGPASRETLCRPGAKLELYRHRTGAPRLVYEISVSEHRTGNEVHFTGTVRDISDRKHVEMQLHRERDLAQVTLASIGDGVITTDEAGMIHYLNPVAERLTGWSAAEAQGRSINEIYRLRDAKTGATLPVPVRGVLTRGQVVSRLAHALLVRRDELPIPVQDTAAPIRSRDGFLIGAVLVFHDVTVTLNLAQELQHQASHDALTGIPNRREFERRLGDLLDRPRDGSQTHVVCFLDLDQFKLVNDTSGHVAGDELLRQVAALIRGHLRASDLLARLGGDEFGLVLECCPMQRAVAMAEAIREDIAAFRFAWQGTSFSIGVSIGLVPVLGCDRDLGAVLSAADAACYAAKDEGRNRVHVYQINDDSLVEQQGQMQWVTRLQQALDEDRLRLYVQPIVPLPRGSEQVPHFEILVRMDEDGRIINPGSFLPAAERYGLMPRVDQWVVRNTLAWIGDRVRREGTLPGVYSINISGASLSDERFRQSLRETLERHRLPAGAVCFEITETSAVTHLSKVVPFIREIKQLGCSFALDDFGSGLSSFAYLKNLPVDFLKIDGNFIKDIAHDPIDLAMVEAINAIGHVMGLKTIAEYVADEEILRQVEAIGIDFAQGYHVGMPVPLADQGAVRMMPR